MPRNRDISTCLRGKEGLTDVKDRAHPSGASEFNTLPLNGVLVEIATFLQDAHLMAGFLQPFGK